ncbi:hypothetical protein BURCENK562V_C4054 [Burkholderia cenocepacia K56-2Valvano]|nr:hypothetical protein BURCENK562V_C4054 [Burkholderia cenocepacia K56-2Valvano]
MRGARRSAVGAGGARRARRIGINGAPTRPRCRCRYCDAAGHRHASLNWRIRAAVGRSNGTVAANPSQEVIAV